MTLQKFMTNFFGLQNVLIRVIKILLNWVSKLVEMRAIFSTFLPGTEISLEIMFSVQFKKIIIIITNSMIQIAKYLWIFILDRERGSEETPDKHGQCTETWGQLPSKALPI